MQILQKAMVGVVAGSLGLFAVGCTHDRPDSVPSSAMKVNEGNRLLRYTAPSNGRLYIFDATDNRILYAGDVMSGDSVSLDTEKNRITVQDKLVAESNLDGGHQYQTYFDARPMTTKRVVIEEKTSSMHTEPITPATK